MTREYFNADFREGSALNDIDGYKTDVSGKANKDDIADLDYQMQLYRTHVANENKKHVLPPPYTSKPHEWVMDHLLHSAFKSHETPIKVVKDIHSATRVLTATQEEAQIVHVEALGIASDSWQSTRPRPVVVQDSTAEGVFAIPEIPNCIFWSSLNFAFGEVDTFGGVVTVAVVKSLWYSPFRLSSMDWAVIAGQPVDINAAPTIREILAITDGPVIHIPRAW